MKTPEDIYPDFPEWPRRWHGVKEDILYGQGILDIIRPFVAHLISQGLGKRTIRHHMDNLWLLGGEIIRSVSTDGEYGVPPGEYLRRHLHDEGGPYCRHLHSESAERSYDGTCRELHKFLSSTE